MGIGIVATTIIWMMLAVPLLNCKMSFRVINLKNATGWDSGMAPLGQGGRRF